MKVILTEKLTGDVVAELWDDLPDMTETEFNRWWVDVAMPEGLVDEETEEMSNDERYSMEFIYDDPDFVGEDW